MLEFLTFSLHEVRYALPSERVIEVVPRVLITPLPGTAPHVLGVIEHRGGVAVAVDLRRRLGYPPRPAALEDHLVIARGARRRLALVVDRVQELLRVPEGEVRPPPVAAGHVAGIVTVEGGLLLIEDLDAALSLDDEQAVDAGLAAR